MARQLKAAGEAVDMVVLLDSPLPVRPDPSALDRAYIKIAELRRKGPKYLSEWWQARAEWKRKQASAPEQASEDAFHNAEIEAAFLRAAAAYEVQPWSGRLVLFRPPLDKHWKVSGGQWLNHDRDFVYHDNNWTQYAPALEVYEVPGDHDSMVLEPNVRVLAAKLQTLLPDLPCCTEAAE